MNKMILQREYYFSAYTRVAILFVASAVFTAISVYLLADSVKAQYGHFLIMNACIVVSLCLVGFSCCLLVKEVNRRKGLRAAHKHQEDNLHIILNSISEGLIAANSKGEIIYANQAAERLSGYSFPEMKQQPVEEIYKVYCEVSGVQVPNMIRRVLSSGHSVPQENHTILHSKTKQRMAIINSGAPLMSSNGKIRGAVLVFSDMPDTAAAEATIKNKDKQFLDLIKNMPQAVYTCDDWGYIQVYNKAAAELWGREPIPGKDQWCGSFKMFDPSTDEEILPEKNPMAVAMKDQKPASSRQVKIQRPDGTSRLVVLFPSLLFDNDGKMTGAVNMMIDITEKKEAELIIRNTEEKYRNLVEQASDPILVVSLDGTIHEFNKSTCTHLGYSVTELKALKLEDLFFNEPVVLDTNVAGRIQAGERVLFRRKVKRKDGTALIAEISSRKMKDGKILAIVRDITEQIKSEKALRHALEIYDMISQATSDTIWDWDIVSQKMKYNKGMELMFGYAITEVSNIPDWWQQNLHPDDRDRISSLTTSLFETKTQHIQMEYRYRCADNTYKNILDRAFIIYDDAGRPVRMIGAMQDITRQKQEEMHINKAIIDTQELERQQMGMELHDNVNQILSASLIYLSTLEHPDAGEGNFGPTLETGKKLVLEAINEIRRLSHQLAPASFESVSMKDVITSLLRNVNAAGKFETDLSIEGDTGLIKGEIRTNLYRILQEQVNNIIKYADATKLEIHVEVATDMVKLKIADNGKGFDPEKVKRGIGLENIKRRVRLYDGKFRLRSAPGAGCEIMALLPLNIEKRA